MADNTSRISPTAHYTGYIWTLNGLSHPAFATPEGKRLFDSLRPAQLVLGAIGKPTLPQMLLARHTTIDMRLTQAIESGRVLQVLEIASGYSPRGWRFKKKFGARIHYLEADLPGVVERKGAMLSSLPPAERPEITTLNALASSGADSLQAVLARFDDSKGVAVITEGLLGYLELDAVRGLWARLAKELSRFPSGVYFSDVRPSDVGNALLVRAFMRILSTFVRGRVYLHFRNAGEAEKALRDAGFHAAKLHETDGKRFGAGARMVQIAEAWAPARLDR